MAEMSSNNKYDKLHRANHGNIKKLWRTVENAARYQFDPIGHVITSVKRYLQKRHFNF